MKNAEAPCELNLDNFAERQRENIRLEKEKLREAKSILNNYRADENKLSKFTESRRRSLEEERAQLEQARKYLNHYHGAEVSPFSQRRRKSLLLEKANQQEAKDYMNNYRSDGTLPTSSRKISSRRHSTGSIKKQSRVSSSAKNSLTPKQLFAPMEDRNPLEEMPNRDAEGKKDKTVTGESREFCFDVPESLLTKMLNCNQPPVSKLDVEGGSGDENKYDNSSKNLPKKALQHENIAIENMLAEDSNNSDHAGSHSDFLAVLLGPDSSMPFVHNKEYKMLMAMGCNDNNSLDYNREIPISCNEKNEQDPYNIDDDRCALSCEPSKSCFGCAIM